MKADFMMFRNFMRVRWTFLAPRTKEGGLCNVSRTKVRAGFIDLMHLTFNQGRTLSILGTLEGRLCSSLHDPLPSPSRRTLFLFDQGRTWMVSLLLAHGRLCESCSPSWGGFYETWEPWRADLLTPLHLLHHPYGGLSLPYALGLCRRANFFMFTHHLPSP